MPHSNVPEFPQKRTRTTLHTKMHARTSSHTHTYSRPPHTLPGLRIRLREMGHIRLTAIFARPGSCAGGGLISRSKIRESSAKGKMKKKKKERAQWRGKNEKKKIGSPGGCSLKLGGFQEKKQKYDPSYGGKAHAVFHSPATPSMVIACDSTTWFGMISLD